MIEIRLSGSFDQIDRYFQKLASGGMYDGLEPLAREGVAALASNTPIESGLAADSWNYEIERTKDFCRITWVNTDIENGFPVAVMLQYGYATGTGGYVQGRDYINPAIKPIFDAISDKVWKAVTTLE